MSERTKQIIQQLAERFIERAENLNYRGKARDKAALDYFIGAAQLAELSNDEESAKHIAILVTMLISTRGYSEVVRLGQPPVLAEAA